MSMKPALVYEAAASSAAIWSAPEARRVLGARRRPQVSAVRRDGGRRFLSATCASPDVPRRVDLSRFDEIYQLAADMGGAGYIFTGENDADIMHNSATINLNMLEACRAPQLQAHLLFLVGLHLSRAQPDGPEQPGCAKDAAYPAAPDSEYGWEKLFSERLYLAYAPQSRHRRCASRAITTSSGREGAWNGGKEKAPAAICRKVARRPTAARSRSGATASRRARSSYRRMPRGHAAADAVRLRPTCSTSARTRWYRSTALSR